MVILVGYLCLMISEDNVMDINVFYWYYVSGIKIWIAGIGLGVWGGLTESGR